MLAWEALNELDAYRITEIPRRAEGDVSQPSPEQPDDAGRTQRVAALIAAYHAGAEAKGNGPGALATRRLNLRHAEIRKGNSAGLWRVRLLAGGADA